MLMKTIDVRETQMSLKELLALVCEGAEIIFTEDSIPLARLTSMMDSMNPRVSGLHEGSMWISDDFDEPLSEEFWTGN